MGPYEIVWVEDGDDRYLAYRCENSNTGTSEAVGLTLEQLADFCDVNSERANAKGFVGLHRILAAMLFKRMGRDVATPLMEEIARYGGLDVMGGSCSGPSKTTTFRGLGRTGCSVEWSQDASRILHLRQLGDDTGTLVMVARAAYGNCNFHRSGQRGKHISASSNRTLKTSHIEEITSWCRRAFRREAGSAPHNGSKMECGDIIHGNRFANRD